MDYDYAISTNAGATWATYEQPQVVANSMYGGWSCNASSADGHILIGMNYNGVWVSTNSGISWVSNVVTSVNWWASVALSADGTKAVAVDGHLAYWGNNNSGGIYVSTNSGMTWSQTMAPVEPWSGVASSADGTILAASILSTSSVPVYVSTNSGNSWSPTAFPTNMLCAGVACSADGSKLVAVGGSATNPWLVDMIYSSTNSGNSWTLSNLSTNGNFWYGVASSADGGTLLAYAEGSPVIAISTNSGASWINAFINLALDAASSADGKKLAIGCEGLSFGIYTSQTPPSPRMNSSLVNGSFALSWLIPSTNFVLQQCSDFTGANWCTMTNTPVLNCSNLQYQVAVPASVGSAFFRLAVP